VSECLSTEPIANNWSLPAPMDMPVPRPSLVHAGVEPQLGRRKIERGAPVADLGVSVGCAPQGRYEE
jgi:hypothetical protein